MEEGEGVVGVNRPAKLIIIIVVILGVVLSQLKGAEGVWCVARSGATDDVLQSALDYACTAGADCGAISESGLCFLPNTLQAHASYAFNSFYQRNHMAASSCSFSGAATLAQTDPSYGSCVYPASPSTAGTLTSNTPGGTPTTNPYGYGTASPLTTFGGVPGTGAGVSPNYMGPPSPATNDSRAVTLKSSSVARSLLLEILLFLLLSAAVY